MTHRDPYVETELVLVMNAVFAAPGIWTARLCRQLNGLAETAESVIYCGLCRQYANQRKRKRAAALPAQPLPGFPAAYRLHPPCRQIALRRLQYVLHVLEDETLMIYGQRQARIPDRRNHRGWDYTLFTEVET
jgi:hypothetical protein